MKRDDSRALRRKAAALLSVAIALSAPESAAAVALSPPAIEIQLSPAWLFGVAILPPMLLLAMGVITTMVLDRWKRN
jgi:hypothetical protein